MEKSKFRVIIIEPSEMIARGLVAILGESELFGVSHTFPDIGKYQEWCSLKQDTDVVIVNPSLVCYGKRGSLGALFPEGHLVALLYNYIDRDILSMFEDAIEVYDKPTKILHKLEQVATSEQTVKPASEALELSDREQEILVAVAKGMMNKEIADSLNISIHTVMAHRKNISRKTGIKSVSGFVVYALLNNLMEEHEVL